MSSDLDSVLDGLRGQERVVKKSRVVVKTDEVVVRCNYTNVSATAGDNVESVEADELIWWSWDGKIVGFGDL